MGEVDHGVVVVGAVKAGLVLTVVDGRFQAAADLGGVLRGEDTDEFTSQGGAGVASAGVHAPGVDHGDHGLFGGLVQGGVGYVVAVRGEDAQASVAFRHIQPS